MFDTTGYDYEAALTRILAQRRSDARAMMAHSGDRPGGFRHITIPTPQDAWLRARSITAARTLQEIGEVEQDFDLPGRQGDALF